ncbi:MAG: hypothetical protein K9G44_04370 [Melioribacteraceae bacterium]|nr:hypothetical protein [Melioribacteraceae bacterium]
MNTNNQKYCAKLLTQIILVISLFTYIQSSAQSKDFRTHTRGVLHQTIYNTGEVGRPAQILGFDKILSPSMEWPGYSATVVNSREYSGQHNAWGGGIWLAGNLVSKPGTAKRIYSFCGGTGKGDLPELPDDIWAFPLSIEKIENFPLNPDGTLNASYDPDEAEEIIISKWNTNLGITVTRTSRAWSYPDYDDMIIYEYEFEYTGNIDGDPEIEQTEQLRDVIISFDYSLGPSLYGYQRWYRQWKNKPGLVDDLALGYSDLKGWHDPDYWLSYSQDGGTAGDTTKAGKPEPDADLFLEFAQTGKNGGGLGSPQAVGFTILYYDTEHLAVIDPSNPNVNESELVTQGTLTQDGGGNYIEIDNNKRLKQPYNNLNEKQSYSTRVQQLGWMDVDYKEAIYQTGTDYEPPSAEWEGRAAYLFDDSQRAAKRLLMFGPYTLDQGEILKFSLAEVAGFGGEKSKQLMGGVDYKQWNIANSWNTKVSIDGQVLTEDYVADFGIPDYVNSDVVSVQDVTHKAWEAYRGVSIPFDQTTKRPVAGFLWPTENPEKGVYNLDVPPPAPIFTASSTEQGPVTISWENHVESFAHPKLTGPVNKYFIYRSESRIGPWKLLDSVSVGNYSSGNSYLYEDIDPTFKVGETKYYSIVSSDANGNYSGKTNFVKHTRSIKAVTKLDEVHVVPNPFYISSGFEGEAAEGMLGFYGLPEKCTINIYSFAGQLIQSIEHDEPVYSVTWLQISRNFQELASGMYYFVVRTPDGQTSKGKFLVIK